MYLLRALTRLRREPGITLIVVLTLGIGIGVDTALIALVDKLMLRPPAHVMDPARLVRVRDAENFVRHLDVRQNSTTLDAAALATGDLAWMTPAGEQRLSVHCVTWNYFRVLGTPLPAGRGFTEDDDAAGAPRTAVIAHGLARRLFGAGDPLGQSIDVGGRRHEITGVAPAGFAGVELAAADLWVPLAASSEICSFTGSSLLWSEGSWLTTIARLRPDATVAAAEAETAGILERHLPLADLVAARTWLEPALEKRGTLARDARVAAWLAGAATAVLVLVSLNVLGLMLIRAIGRRPELAVRLQIGASRVQLLRLLLAEHAVTMSLSAVAAVGVAFITTNLLRAFFAYVNEGDVLHGRALLLAAGLAAAAAAVTAIVPVIEARRADPAAAGAGRGEIGGRSKLRGTFLAVQAALAVVLVIGAAMFVLSLDELESGIGYELDGVAAITADRRHSAYHERNPAGAALLDLHERITALPQIRSASLSSGAVLGSRGGGLTASIRGAARGPSQTPGQFETITAVTPGYFETLGTRILRGRAFTDADGPSGKPVAVVSAGLARDLWPNDDALGRCATTGGTCFEIVGISEPRRLGSITRVAQEFFIPLAQRAHFGARVAPQTLLVRADSETGIEAVRAMAAGLPGVEVRLLRDLADRQTRSWRLGATFFGLFGAIALGLAAVGVYWSAAFAVQSRRRGIGVRIALGAGPFALWRLVLRGGVMPVVIGVALGIVGGVWAMRSIAGLLYGVAPISPPVFLLAASVVTLAACLGCLLPARRAAATNPVAALRG